MTVVKGERRASAALRLCGRSPSLDGLHGDGMGLETTVDQALIRGLATTLPSFVRGHPRLGSGVRRGALPHRGAREFPTAASSRLRAAPQTRRVVPPPSVERRPAGAHSDPGVLLQGSLHLNAPARRAGQWPTGTPPSRVRSQPPRWAPSCRCTPWADSACTTASWFARAHKRSSSCQTYS